MENFIKSKKELDEILSECYKKTDNKIRIIELLNKIANGEELPIKIQYGYDNDNCPAIWRLNTSLKDYCCDERDSGDNYLFRDYIGDITVVLDNEVEILEDNTEEIEELKRTKNVYDMTLECYHDIEKKISNDELADKINELVKAVNQMRKEKQNYENE